MILSSNIFGFNNEFGIKKTIDIFSEAGFEGIDFNLDLPEYQKNVYSPEYYGELREYAKNKGIGFYQTHAPFGHKVEDEIENNYFFPEVAKALENSSYLGAEMMVVHPCREMENYREAGTYDHLLEKNIDFYRRLIPYYEEYGVKIAIENIGWCITDTADGLLDLYNNLNNEAFTICFDAGHAGVCGQDVVSMAKKFGDKIGCTHIHDNDGVKDSHTLPYYGVIDWEAVMKALAECGYKGNLNYEAGLFIHNLPLELRADGAKYMAKVGKHLISRFNHYKGDNN